MGAGAGPTVQKDNTMWCKRGNRTLGEKSPMQVRPLLLPLPPPPHPAPVVCTSSSLTATIVGAISAAASSSTVHCHLESLATPMLCLRD